MTRMAPPVAAARRRAYTEQVVMMRSAAPPHPQPSPSVADPLAPNRPDLRAVAGEMIRDLIRRDPALWVRVQADAGLMREFGFVDEQGTG